NRCLRRQPCRRPPEPHRQDRGRTQATPPQYPPQPERPLPPQRLPASLRPAAAPPPGDPCAPRPLSRRRHPAAADQPFPPSEFQQWEVQPLAHQPLQPQAAPVADRPPPRLAPLRLAAAYCRFPSTPMHLPRLHPAALLPRRYRKRNPPQPPAPFPGIPAKALPRHRPAAPVTSRPAGPVRVQHRPPAKMCPRRLPGSPGRSTPTDHAPAPIHRNRNPALPAAARCPPAFRQRRAPQARRHRPPPFRRRAASGPRAVTRPVLPAALPVPRRRESAETAAAVRRPWWIPPAPVPPTPAPYRRPARAAAPAGA